MEISELVGKTLTHASGSVGDHVIRFEANDGSVYQMFHAQECCEGVSVEDICGDLQDLVGIPIISAEESKSCTNPEGVNPAYQDDSFTWTFYRIATAKGLVVIRWYGSSNGYY